MNTNATFENTDVAKKRIKNLFVAQSAKPPSLEEINLSQLTPFQRALLVADGTVTQFIEAYILSLVEVVRLNQEKQTLPADDIWLEAPKRTTVVARQVILQTQQPRCEKPTVHAYATSLIVHQRLPKVIREGLEIEGEGLGRLLKISGLETRRDLLWCGVEHPKALPEIIKYLEGKSFLSRTYRIVADGKPIILINEKFPLAESTTRKSKAKRQT